MNTTEKSLKSKALHFLSRREMSRLELKRKLAPHAQSEEELESVLTQLNQSNWQSDERYAEVFVHHKSRQYGRIRLKQYLTTKGIDGDIINQFLPDFDTELHNACEVLRKKFRQPAHEFSDKQKQMRFLLYRGFNGEVAQKAMRLAWQQPD